MAHRTIVLERSTAMKLHQTSLLAAGPLAVLTWILLTSAFALGDSISFQITNPSQTITSGGTAVFEGTVTNDSGVTLTASDFFFNFFGYNPAVVTPNQLLGFPDFSLPTNTTSAEVDLFNVTVGVVSKGMKLPVQVSLEDINFDLSSTQTVSVVGSGGTVPEPPSLILLATGLFVLIAARQKHCRWRAH
jgi:PEP-CTERM motif-containing protein